MKIKLKIMGVPFSKQSFRVTRRGNHVHKYQKKEIVEKEKAIALEILKQLPSGFVPFNKYVIVESLTYIFPPLKSFSKAKLSLIKNGVEYRKTTKPDLTDNLNKGLFDAMQGIVYVNDSLICEMRNSKKIYGLEPMTIIELEGE